MVVDESASSAQASSKCLAALVLQNVLPMHENTVELLEWLFIMGVESGGGDWGDTSPRIRKISGGRPPPRNYHISVP